LPRAELAHADHADFKDHFILRSRISKDLFNFFEVALMERLPHPTFSSLASLAAGNAGFCEASSKQLNSFGVIFL